MKLNELIRIASAAYPDDYIAGQCWNHTKSKPITKGRGDTLATFIALELYETVSPNAPDDAQLATAIQSIERAADQLIDVVVALRKAQCSTYRSK